MDTERRDDRPASRRSPAPESPASRPSTPVAALVLILVASAAGGRAEGQALSSWETLEQSSSLYVVTHRSGVLGFLGHDHAILPMEWSAELCLADPLPSGARGSLTVPTGSLVIDSDSARALADLGEGPGEEDRRKMQRTMLDATHLAAERHPEIRLELETTGPVEGDRAPARGTLRIRGVTREVELPITIGRGDGWMALTGRLRARQSDFGIEPESVAGVVNVADEVDLLFRLTAVPTGRECTAPSGGGEPPGP